MKFYGLAGCVIIFLFSILQETYQLDVCSEYRDHFVSVGDGNEGGSEEQIDVKRIYETNVRDGACLLVAWHSESCGPIHFRGNVLIGDTSPHTIDVYSYDLALTMSWLTRLSIERISGDDHIYLMQFVEAFEWSGYAYTPLTLSPETIDRFNVNFAVLEVNEELPHSNYAIKVCEREGEVMEANEFYILQGGCLLKKRSAPESSYNNLLTRITNAFQNGEYDPFLEIKKDVPTA